MICGYDGTSKKAARRRWQFWLAVDQIKEFARNLWYRRATAWIMQLETIFAQCSKIAQALAFPSS
jgi:hypothetical protein